MRDGIIIVFMLAFWSYTALSQECQITGFDDGVMTPFGCYSEEFEKARLSCDEGQIPCSTDKFVSRPGEDFFCINKPVNQRWTNACFKESLKNLKSSLIKKEAINQTVIQDSIQSLDMPISKLTAKKRHSEMAINGREFEQEWNGKAKKVRELGYKDFLEARKKDLEELEAQKERLSKGLRAIKIFRNNTKYEGVLDDIESTETLIKQYEGYIQKHERKIVQAQVRLKRANELRQMYEQQEKESQAKLQELKATKIALDLKDYSQVSEDMKEAYKENLGEDYDRVTLNQANLCLNLKGEKRLIQDLKDCTDLLSFYLSLSKEKPSSELEDIINQIMQNDEKNVPDCRPEIEGRPFDIELKMGLKLYKNPFFGI